MCGDPEPGEVKDEETMEVTTTDAIVICDTCNLGVHQSCYGRELATEVPEGRWECQRCSMLKQKSIEEMSC